MVPQMKVNRAASEMADVMNQARALAVQTGRTHTVAFNNVVEQAHGQLTFHPTGTRAFDDHLRYDYQPARKIATPNDGIKMLYVNGNAEVDPDITYSDSSSSSAFDPDGLVSDNENGTDHWFVLLAPVYYGGINDDGSVVSGREPAWRSPNSSHYYKHNQTQSPLRLVTAGSFNDDGTAIEDRIDEDGIQIGPRYLLPEGVRFWLPPEIGDEGTGYALGRYVPMRRPTSPFRSLQAATAGDASQATWVSCVKFYTNGNANATHHTNGNASNSTYYNRAVSSEDKSDSTAYNTAVGFMWREDPSIRMVLSIQAQFGMMGISSDPQRYW